MPLMVVAGAAGAERGQRDFNAKIGGKMIRVSGWGEPGFRWPDGGAGPKLLDQPLSERNIFTSIISVSTGKRADFQDGTKRGRNPLRRLGRAGKIAATPNPNPSPLPGGRSLWRPDRRDRGTRCKAFPVQGWARATSSSSSTPSPARRGDDIAVLPADRLFQDRGLEAVPALDAFENEEIRDAGRELDVGRADDRAAIEMRRDLRVMRLGHAAIFLASSMPPTRPRFSCRIEAAPVSSTRANSYFVVSRSPVAIGIRHCAATRAISSGASGGVGSSNHRGA